MSDNRFTDSFLAEIRAAVSISEVIGQTVTWDKEKTAVSRGDFWACCPFHGESTPSFHCEDTKGVYHCFGCGESGDHLEFLVKSQGLNFPDAVARVAELAGVPLPGDSGKREPRREASAPPAEQAPIQEEPPQEEPRGVMKPIKGYDYTDRDGNSIYQVIRYHFELPDGSFEMTEQGAPKKTFRQRRRLNGEWVYNLDGVEHTIYRHPAVEVAIAEGKTILLPEGEKDVESLEGLGFVASTNSGGAKNWTPALAALFKDADVIIPVDNDDVGRARGEAVAKSLRGIARRIRVLDLAPHWPEMGPKQDVSDWIAAGGTSDQLEEIIARLPDWRPAPPPSKFGARTTQDIGGSRIVYEWLVKGLIERRGVFVVAGEQQAGKSFFVIDLGMKISRGLDYCGRKVQQGLVIHHAGEDYRGVQMRVDGYCRDNRISAVPYIVTGEGEMKLNLMSDESVDAFIAECLQWEAYFEMKLELVTIDTLSAGAEELDEINGAEVGKVLGRINRIAAKCACAVCVVHHLNGEGKRVRGSTKFTANVAQVIEIRQMTKFQTKPNMPVEHIKDSDGRIVRQAILEKNKNGPNKIKWRFVLRQVLLDTDQDGFQMTTCVCESPSSEVGEGGQRTSKLSTDQKLVYDTLQALMYDEGIDMPAGVKVGPQIRKAVPDKAFANAIRKAWTFRAEEPEARTKEISDALKRIVPVLITNGYMGRDSDKGIVWSLGKDDRRREPVEPKREPVSAAMKEAIEDGVPF